MFTLVFEWKKMKNVWMNEADSVFVKGDSLVEVPYVEPSFWKVLMSSPLIPSLMEYEGMISAMWYAMCDMICVVCKMICMMIHVTLIAWLS